MNNDVFRFRMVNDLIYTGFVTGEDADTFFVVDERVGSVVLTKHHIVAKEKVINRNVKRIDTYG